MIIIYLAKTEADYGDTVTEGFSELGQLPRKGGAISDTYLGTFIPSEATGASSTTGRCDNFETNIASSSLRTLFYGAAAGLGWCPSPAAVGGASAGCGSLKISFCFDMTLALAKKQIIKSAVLVVSANAPLITILMKRISNIFEGITNYNNILYADEKARKGKLHSYGVKHHNRNRERNLHKLQDALTNLTYKTSEYSLFTIHEPKERLIYRLPYFPDRIAHHTLMNYLEPIWEKVFIAHTYACRKNKGIHKAAQDIKRVLRKDTVNTQYCLKLDIKKFYPSIDHEILKSIVRRKIKDTRVLKLLDEIIDSAPGVPIGNYLSQYFANLYLAYFDHWIKECKKIKYYFRYADDIVIFSKDKESLHTLIEDIIEYLNINLKLTVKSNYQVFPLDSRGLDFVGYKFYHTHTLLRKNIKHNMCKCLSRLYNKTYSKSYARRKVCSYFGWLKFCNSINFCKKLVLRVCKKYNLTTPEIFVPKKDIISNVLNRRLKFIGYKIYNKYFKLYVITNKLISVTSKSRLLLSLMRDIISTYIIIIFHKRYNAYEILL